MNKKFINCDLSNWKNLSEWKSTVDKILAEEFPPLKSICEVSSSEIDRDSQLDFSKYSNWEIVCEEILDAEHSHVYYGKCYEELLKRGKTEEDILQMRKFAWMTVGWLNYPMMLWEWCSLDEKDIKYAINLQFSKFKIGFFERRKLLKFLKLHEK